MSERELRNNVRHTSESCGIHCHTLSVTTFHILGDPLPATGKSLIHWWSFKRIIKCHHQREQLSKGICGWNLIQWQRNVNKNYPKRKYWSTHCVIVMKHNKRWFRVLIFSFELYFHVLLTNHKIRKSMRVFNKNFFHLTPLLGLYDFDNSKITNIYAEVILTRIRLVTVKSKKMTWKTDVPQNKRG